MLLRLQTGLFSAAALFLTAGFSLSAAPQLQLSASSIGPIYVAPNTNGSPQSVQASNGGTGTLTLSAATSASWLSASVGTQTTCSAPGGICWPINIALNTSSLAAGNYTEYVTVQAPNAVDSPQQIAVNVVVANVPSSVALYSAPSGGKASVNVYPHSAVIGAVSTQSGGNWLSFTAPPPGQTGFGAPYAITATAQTGQAAGTYTGSVQISGSTYQPDNTTIAVTFNVTNSPVIQINNSQIVLTGYTGGPDVTSSVSFVNVGLGSLAITAASAATTTENFLSVSVRNGNTILITANPSQLDVATYTGSITLTSNAANNSQVSIPVEFSVAPAGPPSISEGGIVNVATFQTGSVAPGDILSVFGDQFTAPNSTFVNPGPPPLATQLGNVQVLVNGSPAPLYYVSRQQINFQMPYETSVAQIATVQVVNTGTAGNIRSVQAETSNPHILVWAASQAPGNYGIIVNPDNTLSLPATDTGLGRSTRPSRPGDVITIYCTGLGQTTPFAQDGQAASSSPLMSTAPVTVTFSSGGAPVTAQSSFAGLTPTLVGLYQVNVTIPSNVPTGASVSLSISMGTATSNSANIPISTN
jgi:uncharacterized protein (TIGR03437 family)